MLSNRLPDGSYKLSGTPAETATLDRAHTEFGSTVLADLVKNYIAAWEKSFALKDKQKLLTAYDKASITEKQAMVGTPAVKVGG